MGSTLDEVHKRLRKFDERINRGCTQRQLDDLVKRSVKELGTAPPEGYLEFLRINDGLEFNGLTIYSSKSNPKKELIGFVEENVERFRGDLELKDVLVFGHDSLDMYLLNQKTGKYGYMSWAGITGMKDFDSFESLLDEMLSSVLKGFD